ncbi:MAG: hypothetical protein D4S01_06250 [Dehalococcoidia bacterium]|nr:MAG: hypothetical protein D4S01_06250 [Dehalococcoidia bacterium]
MKKKHLTWLVVGIITCLLGVTWLTGCASTSEYESLQAENTALAEELNLGRLDYEELEKRYAELTAASELKNPTWAELKEFIERDKTDRGIYRSGEYDCTGFAQALRDNARKEGIKAAFVEIGFYEGSGHAVNAFQTTDKGLVYIDCTGKEESGDYDTVGYIKTGKVYGRIDLSEATDFTYDYYLAHHQDAQRRWEPMQHVQIVEIYW